MALIRQRVFRLYKLAVVLCAFASAFPSSAQQVSHSSTVPAPEAALARAAAFTDIRSPSSSAFLLVADVHFKFDKQTVDGKYGLSWAAPDMYHEIFVFPGFRQDVVVSHDKIYRKRTADFLPLPVHEWQSLMAAPLLWKPGKHAHVTAAPRPKEWNGQAGLNCVQSSIERVIDMREPNSTYKRTACFQTAQGYPVSEDIDDHGRHSSYRFSNYKILGAQAFPGKITYEDRDGMSLEMDVSSLKPVQVFASNEFTPPSGATAETWCSEPKLSGNTITQSFYQAPDPGSGTLPNGRIFLYVHVNPKGLVDKAGLLESSNPEAGNAFVNSVHRAAFPIATCNGTPIPRELIVIAGPR
ncbi:MAG TPA: hypothetical protein VMV59_01025 [Candidatus Dormibacteraeota bacterium]|nr:hypothetical protein [Candidatus Dormibacteraeota bacterium]